MLDKYSHELWKFKNDQTINIFENTNAIQDELIMENLWLKEDNNELSFLYKTSAFQEYNWSE